MKVILYNAISIDGFIATPDGNSDWVSENDLPHFKSEIEKAGAIIVGRTSYEQFKGDLFPITGVLNVVMTHDKGFAATESAGDTLVTTLDPHGILSMLEAKGFTSVVIVGGGKVSASFLAANLIDEIIVDIHPLVIGKGIKIFESDKPLLMNFTLEGVETISEGLIKLRYLRAS